MKKEMTISEFLNRNDETEEVAGYILKNKKLKKIAVFVLANLLCTEECFAATNTKKIDTAGMVILDIIRRFGKWIILAMCFLEVIRSLMQGDTKSVGKIITKYVIAYGAFWVIPWLFTIIEEIFR